MGWHLFASVWGLDLQAVREAPTATLVALPETDEEGLKHVEHPRGSPFPHSVLILTESECLSIRGSLVLFRDFIFRLLHVRLIVGASFVVSLNRCFPKRGGGGGGSSHSAARMNM